MAAATEPLTMQPDRELEVQAHTFAERARALARITNQEEYNQAGEFLHGVKALRDEAERHHRPVIDAAHKAHKAACDALRRVDEPLKLAESIVKIGIGDYDSAQRRIREEAERKAREEAERIAAEQREREIAEAEKDGATAEEVAALCDMPLPPAPRPVVQVAAHKPVSGISTAKTYRARVVDIRKLCAAVAAGTVPHTLVLANETALNAMARSLKGVMSVPGVSVEEDAIVRAGRR